MKKTILFNVLVVSACLNANVHAAQINMGLSEHVFSVDYGNQIAPNANFNLGYVYSEKKGHFADLAVHMTHKSGPHSIELGPKLVSVWADHAPNGSAVAVGGNYGLSLNNHLSMHLLGYYAPSVLSFSDVEGYFEYGGKVQYNLDSNLGLYLGYRHQKFDYKQIGTRNFESGFYFGGSIRF